MLQIKDTFKEQVKLNNENAYVARELGDFSSILKLWRLAEIDAVTLNVLQVLLILDLLEKFK